MKTKIELVRATGGLSDPGKMPGFAWSISALRCLVGSKLRDVPGSACEKCYALKYRYLFENVQNALEKRLALWAIAQTTPGRRQQWRDDMCELIDRESVRISCRYFRWFDSGDLQSVDMLEDIDAICRALPQMRFWMPTREHATVKAFGGISPNLTIRLSAHMVDSAPPGWWQWTSSIHHQKTPHGSSCPAYSQGGQCGDCRKCWDKRTPNVSYPLH